MVHRVCNGAQGVQWCAMVFIVNTIKILIKKKKYPLGEKQGYFHTVHFFIVRKQCSKKMAKRYSKKDHYVRDVKRTATTTRGALSPPVTKNDV